ncbi:hypothetical protein, partial [Actinoplanes sp. NPDC049802]|uniref:hypothetical protein n=1 Tax=Actinoplanes sp. NPDC049802 TaxID=3154742 RepID=UPI0033E37F96
MTFGAASQRRTGPGRSVLHAGQQADVLGGAPKRVPPSSIIIDSDNGRPESAAEGAPGARLTGVTVWARLMAPIGNAAVIFLDNVQVAPR